MQKQITVQTSSHDYPIHIVNKTNDFSEYIMPCVRGKHILIVTNETVAPLYLDKVLHSLTQPSQSNQTQAKENKPLTIESIILPDGEQFKNQQHINRIFDKLLDNHFSRDCTLIALGGGVIGDMTGFAAACYMRGVDFIQVPTTLLAQVDSSVGGKTGINHPLGKNMIGAFWQPRLVLADMSTLTTLPQRELSAGMAEVIKYALIMDSQFLDWLEDNMTAMMSLDLTILGEAVQKCCQFKAQIVKEDERESGRRALLNFGHTFGHVIETHMGYGSWLHGEAVAVGMIQAAKLSQILGWISHEDVRRIEHILTLANLPTTAPSIPVDTALQLMSHDKKSVSGNIRLILLKSLGAAVVTSDFELSQLRQVL